MAVDIDLKFATLLNPEDCPIEELKAQIADLEGKVGFYETKQLAIKKFINSVYGALGSKYFVAYNTAMAESITAQGRDLNHFTEISVNEYFEGLFQSNPEIIVYYQWQHTDASGKHWTFKDRSNELFPEQEYYNSGRWVECKSWEAAVKKGKRMTSDNPGAYSDNASYKCDWYSIRTNLWDKMCLIHEKCKSFDISKGKTTHTGPLTGPEFEYLEGRTESMIIGGDTDSVYVEAGRVIAWCAPTSIYWGVSEETQNEVYKLCNSYPDKLDAIPDEHLRKKVHQERARFETQVIVDMWDYSMKPYMEKKYELYAKRFNCDKNLQDLELEKISDVTLYFAKKRYAMSECWKEPGIFLPYMEEVIFKGVEIVKGSTPSYVRDCMKDFVTYVVHWYGDHTEPMPYEKLIEKLRGYKKNFRLKSPEEICASVGVSNYEKFVKDDKEKLIFNDKTPAFVRAAGIYNFFLNKPSNAKFKMKYQNVGSADKIKWYYSTNKTYDVFAFSPGQFPAEFALPIDYEVQFEKTLLSFCNKVLDILGYMPVNGALCYSESLF